MKQGIDVFHNASQFAEVAFVHRSQIQSMGLQKGRSGIALLYFLLAKHTGRSEFAETGALMLDEMSDNSHLIDGTTFSDGLIGIGYAIEWLVQNDLMHDTNTDEILEAMDNELYKVVSYSKDDNISLATGTLGKIHYFLKRELSQNQETHIYKRLGHKECFVLLTDDLEQVILSGSDLNVNEQKKLYDEIDLGGVLTLISDIKINLNKPTLETILYETVKRTESFLSQVTSLDSKDIDASGRLDFLYLAVSYLITSNQHCHNFWRSSALEYISYLTAQPIEVGEKVNSLFFKKLVVFSLLNIQFPQDNYRNELFDLINIASSQEMPDSLFEGRGAVVLAELCLENPQLIHNWHEIFFLK